MVSNRQHRFHKYFGLPFLSTYNLKFGLRFVHYSLQVDSWLVINKRRNFSFFLVSVMWVFKRRSSGKRVLLTWPAPLICALNVAGLDPCCWWTCEESINIAELLPDLVRKEGKGIKAANENLHILASAIHVTVTNLED